MTRQPNHGIPGRDRHRGTTLVELIISIVIVGIAVSGVLLVMTRTSTHSADPMLVHQAVAIAEAYTEEIVALPFDEDAASGGATTEGALGPDPGEGGRADYDDVNDYDGLLDVGARGLHAPGTVIPGLADYTIAVNVDLDANLGPPGRRVPAADAELVQVTVTHPAGVNITLGSYRTR